MSWSRGARGAPNAVLERVRGWISELLQQDRTNGETDAMTQAHTRQARGVIGHVERAIEGIPIDRQISVEAEGHSDDNGIGSVMVTLSEHEERVTGSAPLEVSSAATDIDDDAEDASDYSLRTDGDDPPPDKS